MTKNRHHINLHWLSVHYRIWDKMPLFLFKALNGLPPSYVADMLHPYTPSGLLRSASKSFLTILWSKLSSKGRLAFAVVSPRFWIDPPRDLRQASAASVFKSELKTFLFVKLLEEPDLWSCGWRAGCCCAFYSLSKKCKRVKF